jgi:thiamine-phosphate pyrophosphorylase
MKPLSECRLYTFVDMAYLHGRSPDFVARQLCEGGADLIQLRAKGCTIAEVRAAARAVLMITQPAGVGLVINDHVTIAEELGAEFCHLGQEDFFGGGFKHIDELKQPSSVVHFGLSTHSPAQAQLAIQAKADYLAVGPVYATPTKASAIPVTLEYVRWAAAHISLPWFAIGGINLKNLEQVLEAGARRICVVSAILEAPDIAARCRQFKLRLEARSL